jgi:hypothetical protein
LAPAITALIPLWNTPADWRRVGVLSRIERIADLLAAPEWRGVNEAQELLELARSFVTTRPAIPAQLAS